MYTPHFFSKIQMLLGPNLAHLLSAQDQGEGSPMVAKGFQGPRGTQGMGEMSFNQIDHI